MDTTPGTPAMLDDSLTLEPRADGGPRIDCRNIKVFYGPAQAIHDVSMTFPDRAVTALIGPSGCGKSTFLRCLNRMNDTISVCRVEGLIQLDGENIYDKRVDPVQLRAKVGMVFQKPNPFPKSIYENVAYGPRIHGMARDKSELDAMVETSLKKAGLWEEVKDRLQELAPNLSGVGVADAGANQDRVDRLRGERAGGEEQWQHRAHRLISSGPA